MIDSVANLLFRCSHRRLTRPVTPVSKAGVPHGQTYVVCLDCGKQFSYDLAEMRVGKPLESSHDAGVLHPDMPRASRNLKYALWLSVPLAFLAGAFLRNSKKPPNTPPKKSA
jgi:DNA-directed RNA polymerase subunit RPC12/RpoP